MLDIHPASDAERIAIYRNVHEFWGRGLSIEEHVARRLNSEQHNRATWFAGCVDGKVVSSLGCYPIHFLVHGDVVPGIAIGAVHTLPEYRGRGFAPRMFEWIEEHYRQAGVKISLLYSDIEPGYYARLGYVECPAFEAWIDVAAKTGAAVDTSIRLQSFDGQSDVAFLRDCEARCRKPLPISIHRTDDYWGFLTRKDPGDRYFRVLDSHDSAAGYLRIGEKREAQADGRAPRRVWNTRDVVLLDTSDEALTALLHAAIRMAGVEDVATLGGWLPDSDAVRALADVVPRTREITMLKSLSPEIDLDAATIAAAEHFQEIDHV